MVDTRELLEFIDTMDVSDTSKVSEPTTQEELAHDETGQDIVDPKSESHLTHSCPIMKVNHPQWIQVLMGRS